ncbi:hypothetical protein P3S67_025119 [Capsicum chacoense]
MIQNVRYYLSEHPSVVNFRWSHSQSWGNTWSFLFTSIIAYVFFSVFLHFLLLLLFRHRRPLPLGPIPAVHSLSMALISLTIFTGILLSAAAEIRETRWFWRRSKTTTFQWLLCFPLGTRPSGRVFFWSYVFYLSRFLNILRTFFTIFNRRKFSFFQLFNHSILIFMSFLWLEFSQSFQILDGDWIAKRVLPVCSELSDFATGVQRCVPCWGAVASFHERWVHLRSRKVEETENLDSAMNKDN